MLVGILPERLFGLDLAIWDDPVVSKVPRIHTNIFDVRGARLGGHSEAEFIIAIAKEPPTISESLRMSRAVSQVDQRPAVICWDGMDSGMMGALSSEGVPYIRDAKNACLPFLGSVISSDEMAPKPKALSNQAQRIILNLIAGRWADCTAGELARLTGKSAASVTKYLGEIKAIAPGLVVSHGRQRILSRSGLSKEGLLDGFADFLTDPAETTIRLKSALDVELLHECGALLAGESALPYFSDLAPTRSMTVAVLKDALDGLRSAAGEAWCETAWYDSAEMTVEVWGYPVDEPSRLSLPSTGLYSVDPLNLYVSCLRREADDVRYLDAVEQLREEICR